MPYTMRYTILALLQWACILAAFLPYKSEYGLAIIWAPIIAAGIAAAGSAAGGWLSSRGGTPGMSGTALWLADQAQKRYEERLEEATQKAENYLQASLWRTEQAEAGKYGIWRALGSGYKPPAGTSYSPSSMQILKTRPKTGVTRTVFKPSFLQKKTFGEGDTAVHATGIAPVAYAEDVLGSPQGQAVDRLTQEAIEIFDRQGEMWGSMTRSVFGAVTDQLAAAGRSLSETMKGMLAKGGDARNTAIAAAVKTRGMEELIRTGAQNVREGMMELNMWARDNLKSQLSFNQMWVQGIPLSNSGYINTMSNLSTLYATTILPAVAGAAGTSMEASMNKAAYTAMINYEQSSAPANPTWGNLIAGLSKIAGAAALDYWGGSNRSFGFELMSGQSMNDLVTNTFSQFRQ